MRIAFFGAYRSFDYNHIGGMDSFTRRLGAELIRQGKEVSFVHFNCPEYKTERTSEGIEIFYFIRIYDTLQYMAKNFDHVLTIYVPPKQRPTWMRFRRNESKRIYFHKLYSGWSEFWFRRLMGFSEAMILPYNGTMFCISPRLKRFVSTWSKRTSLLLPPVPENYFITPEEKPKSDYLRITFMGRIDPGKGVTNAIDLFQFLAKEAPDIQTKICGYPWRHKPVTMKLHEELLMQDEIAYEPTDFEGYTPEVDENVRRILKETDVLFLPYKKLSSTIDIPLLLHEGMAHLCVVVTRPLGSIPEIYGSKEFMLYDISNREGYLEIFRQLEKKIYKEQMRLADHSRKLKFVANEVAYHFNSLIEED